MAPQVDLSPSMHFGAAAGLPAALRRLLAWRPSSIRGNGRSSRAASVSGSGWIWASPRARIARECGEVLIARQGDGRAWHFAHASGSDCHGAADGALHKVAKQLVVREKSVLVPALETHESHRLADGCRGAASRVRPAERLTFSEIRDEGAVGAP